jgi:DNA-binding GntR family transcriptional regulator
MQSISHNDAWTTVQSRTREQAAYDMLRQAIIGGRWQPGESLVVSRIARDIGMSRIPVTNAMKQLASEGFIRMQPHQEAVVASLVPTEVREIYLMRAALEVLAIEEAVERVTDDDIAEIQALNQAIADQAAQPDATIHELRRLDRVFHARIRDIAAMPHVSRTLLNLADQCEYYRVSLLDTHHFAAPSAERHQALIDALAARQVDQARTLMREHIFEGMNLILDAISRSP